MGHNGKTEATECDRILIIITYFEMISIDIGFDGLPKSIEFN